MSTTTSCRKRLLRASSRHAGRSPARARCFVSLRRRRYLDQPRSRGTLHSRSGRGSARLHAVWLVRHRDSGKRSRAVQQAGRPLVSMGDGLVHLLGSDILRGIFRRACSTYAGTPCRISHRAIPRAMAGLQRRLADNGAGYRGAVDADARHGHSTHQYADPAHVGRDAALGASGTAERRPQAAQAGSIRDGCAGRGVPGSAVQRALPRIHAAAG